MLKCFCFTDQIITYFVKKKKKKNRKPLIKCVSFQSSPLNIYQDHVWHFSYLLVKITEQQGSEMTARKEKKMHPSEHVGGGEMAHPPNQDLPVINTSQAIDWTSAVE